MTSLIADGQGRNTEWYNRSTWYPKYWHADIHNAEWRECWESEMDHPHQSVRVKTSTHYEGDNAGAAKWTHQKCKA